MPVSGRSALTKNFSEYAMVQTELVALQLSAKGMPVGESNPLAKHRDAVVEEARTLRLAGMSFCKIGIQLGVSMWTVRHWVCGTRRTGKPVRIQMVRRKVRQWAK